MKGEDEMRRVGVGFVKEMESIQKEKKEQSPKKKEVSLGKLTNKIPKHKLWHKIRKDLINFKFDKRGLATISIFLFIFFVLIWIIVLGIYVMIFNLTFTNLNIDIDIGQVNLQDIVGDTFGKLNTGLLNTADIIGFVIIFGMILNMFINAFLFRGKFPRLFIIIDIVLLVFAYILAVYISNSYELIINSSTELSFAYINTMPRSSAFILRLPAFVGIIGVIIMVLSYAGFPRDTQEEVILGELQ